MTATQTVEAATALVRSELGDRIAPSARIAFCGDIAAGNTYVTTRSPWAVEIGGALVTLQQEIALWRITEHGDVVDVGDPATYPRPPWGVWSDAVGPGPLHHLTRSTRRALRDALSLMLTDGLEPATALDLVGLGAP